MFLAVDARKKSDIALMKGVLEKIEGEIIRRSEKGETSYTTPYFWDSREMALLKPHLENAGYKLVAIECGQRDPIEYLEIRW